jgi:hypothetical protein
MDVGVSAGNADPIETRGPATGSKWVVTVERPQGSADSTLRYTLSYHLAMTWYFGRQSPHTPGVFV